MIVLDRFNYRNYRKNFMYVQLLTAMALPIAVNTLH